METLTIKELAPYLEHKIKVQWHNGKIGILYGLEHTDKNDAYFQGCMASVSCDENMSYESIMPAGLHQIKPLLYPLDYLTKEIEHNGEVFQPWFKLMELSSFPYMDGEDIIEWITGDFSNKLTFSESKLIIDKLCEWHIDFQGLINRGLAIDKTKVN